MTAAKQLTANIAAIGQPFVEKMRSIPLQTLQRIVYGLLAVWLLYALGQLIWLLVPESDEPDLPVAVGQHTKTASPAPAVDIKRLQSFNLFGRPGEQPVAVEATAPVLDEVEINAEKTRLNLQLQGIVSASETSEAVAIIMHQGKQEQYHVGDKLPVGNQVFVAKVLTDYVILDNKGQFESLWLYDDSHSTLAVQQNSRTTPVYKTEQARIKDMRNNVQATRLAQDYRQRLYKNPKSLAEVLRIAPAQQNGQMVGYRVSPGKDRAQFKELGFKANDIVTSINDIALDEPSQALEVYKLMRTASEANFTVLRNGRTVQLMVALGDGNE